MRSRRMGALMVRSCSAPCLPVRRRLVLRWQSLRAHSPLWCEPCPFFVFVTVFESSLVG
jgi:hypothetical protein